MVQKIRRERYVNIPLCASDCLNWFNDCSQDYTCTDNWVRNFDWSRSGNTCPVGSSCKTFQQVYLTAENFCERVWDHSWKVTPDNEHCMRLWFNGSAGNPNDAVAEWKVERIIKTHRLGDSSVQSTSSSINRNYLALLLIPIIACFTNFGRAWI